LPSRLKSIQALILEAAAAEIVVLKATDEPTTKSVIGVPVLFL
jgi:hypothetical protein